MSSNLTGKFISNTYQRIIQIDSDAGSNLPTDGSTSTPDTSKFTILNGLGEIKTSVAIDSAGNTNGGLFLKNTNGYNNVFGIQVSDTLLGEKGLNFFKPISSSEKLNAGIFLKSTGSVWIGYGKDFINNNIEGIPSIPSDVSGVDFYVRRGIEVGRTASSVGLEAPSNGKINIIGQYDIFEGGLFINGEYPFSIFRFDVDWNKNNGNDVETDDLKFWNGHPRSGEVINNVEYTCVIVGSKFFNEDDDDLVQSIGCIIVKSDDGWKIEMKFSGGDGGDDDLRYIIDVMVIKKGFYYDERDTVINMPESGEYPL